MEPGAFRLTRDVIKLMRAYEGTLDVQPAARARRVRPSFAAIARLLSDLECPAGRLLRCISLRNTITCSQAVLRASIRLAGCSPSSTLLRPAVVSASPMHTLLLRSSLLCT